MRTSWDAKMPPDAVGNAVTVQLLKDQWFKIFTPQTYTCDGCNLDSLFAFVRGLMMVDERI